MIICQLVESRRNSQMKVSLGRIALRTYLIESLNRERVQTLIRVTTLPSLKARSTLLQSVIMLVEAIIINLLSKANSRRFWLAEPPVKLMNNIRNSTLQDRLRTCFGQEARVSYIKLNNHTINPNIDINRLNRCHCKIHWLQLSTLTKLQT